MDRVDAGRRMRRYYALRIEPSLFGHWILVREWGRIGSSCHRRSEHWPTIEAAQAASGAILQRKLRRGYRLRS